MNYFKTDVHKHWQMFIPQQFLEVWTVCLFELTTNFSSFLIILIQAFKSSQFFSYI